MKAFVRYFPDGSIIGTGVTTDDGFAAQVDDGDLVIEVDSQATWGSTHYVLDGVVTAKTAMTPTVTGTTISGLPTECEVVTNGYRASVTDGSAVLTYGFDGTYDVTITSVAHLPYTTSVTQ